MKFWKKSLLVELVGSYLIVTITTVSGVGYVAYTQARDALTEAAFSELRKTAGLKEDALNRWVTNHVEEVFSLSQMPEIRTLAVNLTNDKLSETERAKSKESLRATFRSLIKTRSNLKSIAINDRKNVIVLSTNDRDGRYVSLHGLTYFSEGSKEDVTVDFYPLKELNRPAITLATPILNDSNRRRGLLLAELNLSGIDDIIRATSKEGSSEEIYLVGDIGAQMTSKYVFVRSDKFDSAGFEEGLRSTAINAVMSGENGEGIYLNYKGDEVIGVYRWLEKQDQALLAEIHTDEAFAPARRLALIILLVGLVSAGILGGVVILLARRITRPVVELTGVAQKMSEGSLNQVAPILTENEIGMLAEAFNRMAAQLRATFEEIEGKNLRLEQLDKLKDEFLANTTHELKTPLNGIIGIADSLLDGIAGALNPGQIGNLKLIISSGKRLTTLVNDILDFSRLRDNEIVLQEKPVDFHDVVQSVLSMSRVLLEGKAIELRNNVSGDMLAVFGDENRLHQVMYNLIGNAIKFTEDGSVAVGARLTESDPPWMEVTVSDTGIGIPRDKLELVFENFEQVDASTARKYGGTGLGLSITRQFVEMHGGRIWVESELGRGSHFIFTLPVTDEKPLRGDQRHIHALQETVGLARKEGTAGNVQTEFDSDFTILIVDDEKVNRQVLANHLSLEKISSRQAVDGHAALEIFTEESTPGLVLLDVMMPEMSGYEVCRELRKNFSAIELPIILLTAKNQIDDLVDGFAAGANDFLTKPFSKTELLARIRNHMEITKLNTALARATRQLGLLLDTTESMVQSDKKEAVLSLAADAIRKVWPAMDALEGHLYAPDVEGLREVDAEDSSPMVLDERKFSGYLVHREEDAAVFSQIEADSGCTLWENRLLVPAGLGGHLLGVIEFRGELAEQCPPETLSFMSILTHSAGVVLSHINVHQSLEQRVLDRTRELYENTDKLKLALADMQELKQQQDGDYFLMSLLLKPLNICDINSSSVQAASLVVQKKKLTYRRWKADIGGDINIVRNVYLQGASYVVFMNADAMGKSLQGSGGAIVVGSIFQSIIEHTCAQENLQATPDQWVSDTFLKIQKIFEGFGGAMLISMFMGLVDEANGMVYYINAEHPTPVLYRDGRAGFIENEQVFPKLGSSFQGIQCYTEILELEKGDVLISGSDGRDDILLNTKGYERALNDNPDLFLKQVELGKGNLDEVCVLLEKQGELTDDLSMIRIEYN